MAGKLVVMASRALARVAKTPDDYARVYGRILRQVREPVIIHWLGEMFDPALTGYWGSTDHAAAMETCLGHPPRQCGQDRWREDFTAVEGKGDRNAAEAAGWRADVSRRRLELRRTDRRRRRRLFRRAARHIRCHRTGRVSRARPACRRRLARLSRHSGADRSAIAPYLQSADAVLQDRRRVSRLAERLAGPLHHGRRPGKRPLAAASRRTVPAWPTKPACLHDPDLAASRMGKLLAMQGLA